MYRGMEKRAKHWLNWPIGNQLNRMKYKQMLWCGHACRATFGIKTNHKMSLYDDLDSKQSAEKVDGWSSGIKLLQQQLVAKKTSAAAKVPRKSGNAGDSAPYRTSLTPLEYPKPINSPLFAGEWLI